MQPQEETVTEFVSGYFTGLVKAAHTDYNTFTMVLFAVFASLAFGVARGLAYATGLYAVLHFLAGAMSSISQSIGYVGNCVRESNDDA